MGKQIITLKNNQYGYSFNILKKSGSILKYMLKYIIGDTMVKSENIEYAISETIKEHPEFKPYLTQILLRNIQEEIFLRNFTSKNGARDKVEGLRNIDLVNYIVEQMIKIVNAATNYSLNDPSMEIVPDDLKYDSLLRAFPYYEECKELLESCADGNKIIYFIVNPVELIRATDCVMKTKFSSERFQAYINSYGNINVPLKNTTTDKLLYDLRNEYEIFSQVENIKINKQAINQCLADLITGEQLLNRNNDYTLNGNLFASQKIGRKENQEDSVIIMNHPNNPNFSLLAVADGMGGCEYGELASSYLTKELAKWFELIPTSLYQQPFELQELFNQKLAQISKEIYNEYNSGGNIKAGTTFTGAIVTAEKTIISSVGDSRAYTLGDNGINIVTRDESQVWPQNYSASQLGFDFIDDIRFNKLNNRITNCVGKEELENIQCYQIPNLSYDKLLLLTDGVTDLLDTERIKFISQNTPVNEIVKTVVDEAIQKSAYRPQGGNDYYNKVVNAGKDNASAAMYVRRQ